MCVGWCNIKKIPLSYVWSWYKDITSSSSKWLTVWGDYNLSIIKNSYTVEQKIHQNCLKRKIMKYLIMWTAKAFLLTIFLIGQVEMRNR